jgi:hypothetical protein
MFLTREWGRNAQKNARESGEPERTSQLRPVVRFLLGLLLDAARGVSNLAV